MNQNDQIAKWKTTQPTSEEFGIKVGLVLGFAITKQFALMKIYFET
jgi:hypothetical protein